MKILDSNLDYFSFKKSALFAFLIISHSIVSDKYMYIKIVAYPLVPSFIINDE